MIIVYTIMGLVLIFGLTFLGTKLGIYLDEKFETEYLGIIGFIFGICLAIATIIQIILLIN